MLQSDDEEPTTKEIAFYLSILVWFYLLVWWLVCKPDGSAGLLL